MAKTAPVSEFGGDPLFESVNQERLEVAVVSRFPSIRAGLRSLLVDQGVFVWRESSDAADPTIWRQHASPSIAILDIAPGELTGLIEIIEEFPLACPLLLGPLTDLDLGLQHLARRTWGYLRREAGARQVAEAVRALATGLTVIDPDLMPLVLTPVSASRFVDAPPGSEDLTAREREVLELVAAGLANKMIAARLGISEHTVKFHVAAILSKLGAASRTEAGFIAARRGLIAL